MTNHGDRTDSLAKKAIAAYFKDSLDLDHVEENGGRTKSHMILRPQYWRGQERGTRSSPVHMRHLRPLCKAVSSGGSQTTVSLNVHKLIGENRSGEG